MKGDILPWLHVRPVDKLANPLSTRDYVIADEYNRELTLRGACFEAEERESGSARPFTPSSYTRGNCPFNSAGIDENGSQIGYFEPPICGIDGGAGKFLVNANDTGLNDFATARAIGLSIVRICLSWSQLEPTPGVYSEDYLNYIALMVSWAREQGIYVILDMHQDLFSLFIQPTPGETSYPPFLTPSGGQDGAPLWAIETDGFPPLAPLSIGDLNLAINRAFDNFYNNSVIPGVPQGSAPGPGLADHYIGAIAALSSRFINESTVAGIEIMNEPLPGIKYMIDPQAQARELLYPFYKRVVQAITGERDGLPDCPSNGALPASSSPPCAYPDLNIHDTRHMFFFEPAAERNTFDTSLDGMGVWTNYSNIVFAPHVYSFVFTLNVPNFPPSFAFAYQTAWAEANKMKAPVFVTEFGAGTEADGALVQPTLDQAELYQTGGTIWSWKSNCGDGTHGCDSPWTMFKPVVGNGTALPPNGPLWPARERLMSRTHSRGAPGEVIVALYNVTTRSYALAVNLTDQGWKDNEERAQSAAALPNSAWAWVGKRGDTDNSTRRPRLDRLVTGATYTPSLPTSLSANGSLVEIYIPRSIAAIPVALENCVLVGITSWPDKSRTAFFKPSGPGMYTLGVPGEGGGGSGSDSDSTSADLLAQLNDAVAHRPIASASAATNAFNEAAALAARGGYDVSLAMALLEAVERGLLPAADASVLHAVSHAKGLLGRGG